MIRFASFVVFLMFVSLVLSSCLGSCEFTRINQAVLINNTSDEALVTIRECQGCSSIELVIASEESSSIELSRKKDKGLEEMNWNGESRCDEEVHISRVRVQFSLNTLEKYNVCETEKFTGGKLKYLYTLHPLDVFCLSTDTQVTGGFE